MSKPEAASSQTGPSPQSYAANAIIVVVSLTCCFPLGLYIVWTHPIWSKATKWGWTCGWLFLLMIGSISDSEPDPEVTQISEQAPMKPAIKQRDSSARSQDKLSKARRADDFESKLHAWTEERSRLRAIVERLINDRTSLESRIRQADNDLLKQRVYAAEIVELDIHIKATWATFSLYDSAITKAESTVRRIERRKLLDEAAVTDQELDELAATVLELDETLKRRTNKGPELELQIDEIINKANSFK